MREIKKIDDGFINAYCPLNYHLNCTESCAWYSEEDIKVGKMKKCTIAKCKDHVIGRLV